MQALLCSGIVVMMHYFLRQYLRKVVRLMRDKEMAEHQAEIKTKFLSTMSHEIRTPMNGVIGLSNILLTENPREDQVQNLRTLKFSADLLLALINDILDYSKLEAGKISFEKIDFNLHHLVKNIISSLQITDKAQGLELIANIEDNVPKFVVGDPVRLSQILTNLVGNAIKFTKEGHVKVTLKLGNNSNNIRFEIEDTGIGISKEKYNDIFQSFSQADTATTRKYGGTGLGLSITKKLLELQGSRIHVESEVNKGSVFFFNLNLPTGKENKQDTETNEEAFNPNVNFDGAPILLVEDNRINVMVAKKFLTKWGLKVDVAENGQVAVDKVKENDYCLVLMDLDMPVMDGYQATKTIRSLGQDKFNDLPIIALSASAVADFKIRAMQSGMDEFITKPFQPKELFNQLSKFIPVAA